MVFLFGTIFWVIVISIAFAIVTIPITIPLALWLHLHKYAGGGAGDRKIRRENRKAEKEYVTSLSAEDKKAYLWHKKRRIAYFRYGQGFFGSFRTYKPEEWEDVTKAPDHMERIPGTEDKYMFSSPDKWKPPKTIKSIQANELKTVESFMEAWIKHGKERNFKKNVIHEDHIERGMFRGEDMVNFNYSIFDIYSPSNVIDIRRDGEGTVDGGNIYRPITIKTKRYIVKMRALKDNVPMVVEMMIGLSDATYYFGHILVAEILTEKKIVLI